MVKTMIFTYIAKTDQWYWPEREMYISRNLIDLGYGHIFAHVWGVSSADATLILNELLSPPQGTDRLEIEVAGV